MEWRLDFVLPESGERQPEQESKLKCIIEREPVDNADEAFNHTVIVSDPSKAYRDWPALAYVKKAKTTQY